MESFGDHLGADKDVGFASTKLFEHFVVASLVFGCVGIKAEGAHFGEDGVEGALDMFGAGPFELEGVFCFARGALRERAGLMVAEVACEEVVFFVEGEGDGAVGTLQGVSARLARRRGVESAPIEEKKCLLADGESFFDAV